MFDHFVQVKSFALNVSTNKKERNSVFVRKSCFFKQELDKRFLPT